MTLAERLQQPDLADLPDWAAAEALNSPDETLPLAWIDVPCESLRRVIMERGEWGALRGASASGTGPTWELAVTVVDAITLQSFIRMSADPPRTAAQQMLAALVQAGILSQSTVDAMLATAQRRPSWAEANGILVDARAVGLARGGE
jgi:hypothetical protein